MLLESVNIRRDDGDREFWVGDIVRHFKYETSTAEEKAQGKYTYVIKCFALHSANKDLLMVVYQALYDDKIIWVRHINEFADKVEHEKYPDIKQEYRFEVISSSVEV